jgi:hypothetical protein
VGWLHDHGTGTVRVGCISVDAKDENEGKGKSGRKKLGHSELLKTESGAIERICSPIGAARRFYKKSDGDRVNVSRERIDSTTQIVGLK